MNLVEVANRDTEMPSWEQDVSSVCLAVLDALGVDCWELSVLFCSDQIIRELNRQYRGKDEPTDILSFSQMEDNHEGLSSGEINPAGDLVISLETTSRYCSQDGVPLELQVKRLLIHGILHLQGMDHEHGEGLMNNDMIKLQEKLLDELEESLV